MDVKREEIISQIVEKLNKGGVVESSCYFFKDTQKSIGTHSRIVSDLQVLPDTVLEDILEDCNGSTSLDVFLNNLRKHGVLEFDPFVRQVLGSPICIIDFRFYMRVVDGEFKAFSNIGSTSAINKYRVDLKDIWRKVDKYSLSDSKLFKLLVWCDFIYTLSYYVRYTKLEISNMLCLLNSLTANNPMDDISVSDITDLFKIKPLMSLSDDVNQLCDVYLGRDSCGEIKFKLNMYRSYFSIEYKPKGSIVRTIVLRLPNQFYSVSRNTGVWSSSEIPLVYVRIGENVRTDLDVLVVLGLLAMCGINVTYDGWRFSEELSTLPSERYTSARKCVSICNLFELEDSMLGK